MAIAPEYLSLKDLACYSGLSERTLHGFLHNPGAPLPYYQPGGGKILVKCREFDEWMAQFKRQTASVDAMVDHLLRKVS